MQCAKSMVIVIVLAWGVLATDPGRTAFGEVCPLLEFEEPKALHSIADSDTGDDERPQLATDGQGNWIVVWQSTDDLDPNGPGIGSDADVLFSISVNNGADWDVPLPIDSNADSDGVREDTSPRIATDKLGNWVIVWESQDPAGGTTGVDKDILFSVRTDDGASWSSPAWLHDPVVHNKDDEAPQIVADGNGKWVAIWFSRNDTGGIGTDNDILFSWTDNIAGQNPWAEPTALNTNADVDSAFDGDPQIATDGKGNWVTVWESQDPTIGEDIFPDILYSRGTDIQGGGVNWIPPEALERNAGSDGFSFDLNPHIATDGADDSVWMAVWESNINLDDPGGSSGADPRNILVSLGTLPTDPNDGVEWLDANQLPPDLDGETDDANARVATNGDGVWFVVWQALPTTGQGEINKDIAFSRSLNGVDWSRQDELNPANRGSDERPGIATDGFDQWVVVWQSDDARDGTNPADSDILFARYADCNLNDINDTCDTGPIGESNDCDGNGEPDECQPDCDGDSILDVCEFRDCPVGDPSCDDCNNNGVPDECDIADCRGEPWCQDCTVVGTQEGNGIPDGCEGDFDGDTVVDSCDNCPIENTQQEDCDGDGEGDACETDWPNWDDDGDGVCNGVDKCVNYPNPANQILTDCNDDGDMTDPGEGIGEQCDQDQDGLGDVCDNCDRVPNPGQEDCDGDCPPAPPLNGVRCGDACDAEGDRDNDGDGVCNDDDNCRDQENALNVDPTDCNGDGDTTDPGEAIGEQCDQDQDGRGDVCDNCPTLANLGQEDCDGDSVGDVCAIADGLSLDCNDNGVGNGVPDECEIERDKIVDCPSGPPDCDPGPFFCDVDCDPDCNVNGIPDGCDIDSGFSDDCGADQGNGEPDECELAAGDCNGSGVADSCDIERCALDDPDCSDCNNNEIPDICDLTGECAGGATPPGTPCQIDADCTSPDTCDGALSEDLDINSIPDECEFGPPRAAPYPHDRRKNRYISFDPNKTANDGRAVAFKIELIAITLGSCEGNGGFCRENRGSADCNECSEDDNACIKAAIDCAPNPPQVCAPTGETCKNDAPDAGGTSAGRTWWVGPESPLGNGVHLMVSEPFRLVSINWPNPTHVGDCEIAPQARYGVRAVLATPDPLDTEQETEIPEVVETTLSAEISGSSWADLVGRVMNMCDRDIGGRCSVADTICHGNQECPTGESCVYGMCNLNGAMCQIDYECDSVCSDHPSMVCLTNDICPDQATGETCEAQVCNLTNACETVADCPAGVTECDLAWTLPDRAVNFDDIAAVLALQAPGPESTPPHMTWVDLHGNESGALDSHNFDPPNYTANVSDVKQVVFAFQGRPYTFYDPADCPLLGACCDGGTCTAELGVACVAGGRVYKGDEITCTPNPCP